MRLKIKVTQKHIKKGRRYDPRLCPVALALLPYLKKGAEVDSSLVFVPGTFYRVNRYKLPFKVRAFIRNFDGPLGYSSWTEPKPFSFTLNVKKADLRA